MARVTVSDHIAAPVEKVFEVFTDIQRAAEHVSAIKEVEILTQGHFARACGVWCTLPCWSWVSTSVVGRGRVAFSRRTE